MKFKLTALLIMANLAVFFAIWSLERTPVADNAAKSNFLDFTVLEISGKTLDKPRILKLENNRWRIVSPIDWSANYYAVSRIKNQLEFLDKEASFPVSEIKKMGQTLADFGLDDPAYTFKYGDGRNMRELKIGRSAPVGDRIYMLDTEAERIIVVDKILVENFASNIDGLRGQNIFDIPRFEVSAFSIRISPKVGHGPSSSGLRRIGLVKDGNAWNFETPIVAGADSREVSAFLDGLLSLSARSFVPDSVTNTGLDVSSFPAAITIQGTNRKQTILLGNTLPNGVLRYARLEENATVFVVDATMFKNLGALQTSLRDKAFLKFDDVELDEIDIDSPKSSVKLKKLGNGQWDAVGKNSAGSIETAQADFAIVNTIITRLKGIRARDFVTDAPGDDAKRYGFDAPRLKITIRQTSGKGQTLIIGASYPSGNSELLYSTLMGEAPVYGILPAFWDMVPSDVLGVKSRTYNVLPEKAVIKKVTLSDLASGETLFELDIKNGDVDSAVKPLPEKIRIAAFRLCESVKKFSVSKYLTDGFDEKNAAVDGKTYPWKYKLSADIIMPGTGGDKLETRTWLFSGRVSGTVQYGASPIGKVQFEIPQQLIDSIGELTIETKAPAIFNSDAPKPLTEIPGETALPGMKPGENIRPQ